MIEVAIVFGIVGVLCSLLMFVAALLMARMAGERIEAFEQRVTADERAIFRLQQELEAMAFRDVGRNA